ncbi:MAG TPA: MBL fold metallo-hydrolase [Methanomassiliicoccaceae archaeon]|jgi:N-acyl homoserine lactone hydrolase|nr:MBL fold metallo-hydrolase [Euryarchaeota archaeon]HOB38905.1 MBL fold metallo-hydrolase [Methanomassiliicoccaceae archaeon]HOL07956.1 MBL fold metallo-hydrolase [Methanomassiliicoccaceae archaeon]HOQ26179.1 MBL fold metallo-hydrolase [Methanomassiliicoccaceae archaeon]HPP44453.1 MBL fold metallo-hydrolase [Methanomassiliicoccaceae archaeon]
MNQVVTVVTGRIRREGKRVVEAHSTSTLVLSPEARILVDTSSRENRSKLMEGLERARISPSEIDVVVLTHLHHDHMGNLDLFPRARKLARAEERPFEGIEPVTEDMELAPGVSLLHTPGHTLGSMSVVARTDGAVFAIAGDAMPTRDNHERWLPPGINVDPQLALSSMERICRAGDMIVPGHGGPFPSRRGR